jgi:hypothetical protein
MELEPRTPAFQNLLDSGEKRAEDKSLGLARDVRCPKILIERRSVCG